MRQYQYSDCHTDWVKIQDCPSGSTCSGGSCSAVNQCTSQWLGSYQCSGNYRQQLWQNSDCSTTWINQEYCPGGCSGSTCYQQQCPSCSGASSWSSCLGNQQTRINYRCDSTTSYTCQSFTEYQFCSQPCQLDVDVSTPSSVRVGEDVIARVRIENDGSSGTYTTVDAWVCRNDWSDCREMNCDGYTDKVVYVSGDSSVDVICKREATESGYHRIKASVSGCGVEPTRYSDWFNVLPRPDPICSPHYLNEFRCVGDNKQQKYARQDCSIDWLTTEVCAAGCSNGKCNAAPEPAKGGTPLISLASRYKITACEPQQFTFDIVNIGKASDTFKLTDSGDAADWVNFAESVTLDKDEHKTITAYVNVPCGKGSEHSLTITAYNGDKHSATTILDISQSGYTGWFVLGAVDWYAVALVVLVFLILLGLLLLLLWLLRGRRCRGRRCRDEHF